MPPWKPELSLPEEAAPRILQVARQLDEHMQYDFESAIGLAEEELRLLRDAEEATGRRLHKGHPLHNLGVAWFRRRPARSRRYFFAAHAEDARLWTRRRPASWLFLAERMLTSLFHETATAIRGLERLARRFPRRDPLEVADDAMEEIPPPQFPDRTQDILSVHDLLRIPEEERIFVGGSYPSSMDRIDIIESACRDRSFEPVIVAQYRALPEERARPKSFRLLELCSAAVFEGTARVEPGWWPEIERIVQVRPVPTLVAYLALRANEEIHTSSMFPGNKDHAELDVMPWGTPEHLKQTVGWWLDRLSARRSGIASATFILDTVPAEPVQVTVPSGIPYLIGSNMPFIGQPPTYMSNASAPYGGKADAASDTGAGSG